MAAPRGYYGLLGTPTMRYYGGLSARAATSRHTIFHLTAVITYVVTVEIGVRSISGTLSPPPRRNQAIPIPTYIPSSYTAYVAGQSVPFDQVPLSNTPTLVHGPVPGGARSLSAIDTDEYNAPLDYPIPATMSKPELAELNTSASPVAEGIPPHLPFCMVM